MDYAWSTRNLRQLTRKIVVEECPRITIAGMARGGLFSANELVRKMMRVPDRLDAFASNAPDGQGFRLHLSARMEHSGEVFNVEVHIERSQRCRTALPYRFRCPGKPGADGKHQACGRRVDALYFPDHPELFYPACRICHGLSYLSRQMRLERRRRNRPRVNSALLNSSARFPPPNNGNFHDPGT